MSRPATWTISSAWLIWFWFAVMAVQVLSLPIQVDDWDWSVEGPPLLLLSLLLLGGLVFFWRKRRYFGRVRLVIFVPAVLVGSILIGLFGVVTARHTFVEGAARGILWLWVFSALTGIRTDVA